MIFKKQNHFYKGVSFPWANCTTFTQSTNKVLYCNWYNVISLLCMKCDYMKIVHKG